MMKESFTDASKKHVFIVGCKGIPTRYGGFETFVDKLTEYKKSDDIQYHVARIVDGNHYDESQRDYEYNDAHCFDIKQRVNGPAKAIFYDVDAIRYSLDFIEKHHIKEPVILSLIHI